MAGADTVFAGSILALYDLYLEPLIFAPYAADLAARIAGETAERILETTASTGILTRAGRLAARGGDTHIARSMRSPASSA